jgi:vanillate O-demethylase ferredoxin subunit
MDLVDPLGQALPPFSPGSHIDVEIAPGLVRQYSLCNHPSDRLRYQIAVLRSSASRGGSIGIHDAVCVGDIVRISAPRNNFPLIPRMHHAMLLAGGIGITPILCMAQYLLGISASFELEYCSRSRSRTAFSGLLESSTYADRVTFHFDDGPEDQKLDLDQLFTKLASDTHVYLCGPVPFMSWILANARKTGFAEGQLHSEYFAAPTGVDDERPFVVKIASTGVEYDIPAGKTIVAVLSEAGIAIPTFCEQGTCGTCLTRLLAGIPDHRDVLLTAEQRQANDQFTPCCSRAKSDLLVLDL